VSYVEEKGGMRGEEGECQNGKRKGRDKKREMKGGKTNGGTTVATNNNKLPQ